MIAEVSAPAAMAAEDLDSTVVRRLDELKEAITKKPGPPPWLLPLVMYLVGHLVGSIWWAATMQADVRYLLRREQELWQKLETHDLQLGKMDKVVRDAVKEAMAESDYVRVGRKGD